MIIKKIQLINWQAHKHLILDFVSDINVITGLSNVGKSSIRRAIDWLCFNANISESDYRTENTDETSVKIWLDNEFAIERIRSNSINRYILSKEGCEDKVFDKFGINVPEEIQQVIQVKEIEIENEKLNLNIAEQLSLPFLLDKSATFRAKLFNKLTGNELLDKLFKEFNKENLRINREIKETEESITIQENQLADYSKNYKALKEKLNLVKEQYNKLKEEIVIYENLKDLSEKLKTNKENQEFVNFKASQIKIISEDKIKELKAKAEELKKLQELSYELEATNEAIEKLLFQKSKIKIVDANFEELKKSNELLQKLQEINNQFTQNKTDQEKVIIQLSELKILLDKSEKELKEIWDKNPICPLCGKGKDQCHTNETK